MPSKPAVAAFIGRPGPWSTEQNRLIENALPKWHEFSLVENKDLEGRDQKLTQWKKREAERIMSDPKFGAIPENVRRICSL